MIENADPSWFVVNARSAQWRGGNGRTPICSFEGDHRFEQLGINVTVLEPGLLASLYHAEDAQEDFLVLAGSCRLLIDGEERLLQPWDFVHCPPDTPHAFVAAEGRCVLLQVGARPATRIVYPVAEIAQTHGAAAERETSSVGEAYGSRRREPIPYDGWLGTVG